MDSQANNLYETASQPDTGNDAYTFLEFNTQGEDFDYPEFQELSQPVRSSSVWPPAPTSDAVSDAPDRASSGHQSDASPVSATSGKGRGGGGGGGGGGSSSGGNQAAVDALAAGMSGLNFEETGDDESYEYGKEEDSRDFGPSRCQNQE